MQKFSFKVTKSVPHADGVHVDHHVEWTHADGPVKDTELAVVGWDAKAAAAGQYPWLHTAQPAGTRAVVADTITLPTPDCPATDPSSPKFAAMMFGRAAAIAANLGVEA